MSGTCHVYNLLLFIDVTMKYLTVIIEALDELYGGFLSEEYVHNLLSYIFIFRVLFRFLFSIILKQFYILGLYKISWYTLKFCLITSAIALNTG